MTQRHRAAVGAVEEHPQTQQTERTERASSRKGMLEQWGAGDLPGDSRDTRRERGAPQSKPGSPETKRMGGPETEKPTG